MKKFFFIPVFLCFISIIQAQETKKDFPYKNSLKLDPISFTYNSIVVKYENYLSKRFGFMLSEGFYFNKERPDNVDYIYSSKYKYSITGLQSELHFREYLFSSCFSENNWDRLYISPFALYNRYVVIDEYLYIKKHKISSTGIGLLLGYNLIFRNLSVDIYGGGLAMRCKSDYPESYLKSFGDDKKSPTFNGLASRLGITLGFCF